MILERLKIVDFRVFQGVHEFDFEPRKKYGKTRPIILFGGLNGAGKTTILTAVLITLYGRQSLGMGTQAKTYHSYLEKAIHRSRKTTPRASSASLRLTFTFARMGVISRYAVDREWEVKDGGILETLRITRDGYEMADLTNDQAQAFLNELIPIGVSDLFFFDGEKIKSLAEDRTGATITDAIKKLLGLNLIDRLNSDLNVLIRNYQKAGGDNAAKDEIAKLETRLNDLEDKGETLLEEYEQLRTIYVERSGEADRMEAELQSLGGAWSETKKNYEVTQRALLKEKTQLEDAVRTQFSGSFPLCVAPVYLSKLSEVLHDESQRRSLYEAHRLAHPRLTQLKKQVRQLGLDDSERDRVLAIVGDTFGDIEQAKPSDFNHDIGEGTSAAIQNMITSLKDVAVTTGKLTQRLEEVTTELEEVDTQLARAPDTKTLESRVNDLSNTAAEVSELKVRLAVLKEERKRNLRDIIETTRKLQHHYNALATVAEKKRSCELAVNAKGLLKDYVKKATEARSDCLEEEFIHSFHQLAGKKGTRVRAQIDTVTFAITMMDEEGNVLGKDFLSAGEKQIYAIAVLQALAKTSGHSLPIIIDTPLGRLDSKHRTTLAEHYFPNASQQVIILSTDTEVDNKFYQLLSKHISHAYRLVYNPQTESTSGCEGYFWRQEEAA